MDRRFMGLLAAGFAGGVLLGVAILPLSSKALGDISAKEAENSPHAVTMPFDPPRFVRLRYAYEMRTERDAGVQTVTSTDELTFLPGSGGGYTVRWKTRDYAVDAPPPARAMLTRTQRIAKQEPLLITVSADGVPRGLVNETQVRNVADALSVSDIADEDLADVPAESREGLLKLVAEIGVLQRNQSPQAFAEAMLENPRLLLRNVGALVPGRVVTSRIDVVSRIDGQHIRFDSRTELRRLDPGKVAEIVITSVADPKDARRTMQSMIGPVLEAIPDKLQREAASARIAEMGDPTISDETAITIDLPSGLVRTLVWRKRLYMPGRGTTVETRSFRRMA